MYDSIFLFISFPVFLSFFVFYICCLVFLSVATLLSKGLVRHYPKFTNRVTIFWMVLLTMNTSTLLVYIYLSAVGVIKPLFLVAMSSVTCCSIQNMATPYRPVNQLFYNIPRWSIAKSSALVSTKINYFLKKISITIYTG